MKEQKPSASRAAVRVFFPVALGHDTLPDGHESVIRGWLMQSLLTISVRYGLPFLVWLRSIVLF